MIGSLSRIVKLSRLYHYILTTRAGDLVNLEQELPIARNYVELEQLRFGGQLEYTIQTEGNFFDRGLGRAATAPNRGEQHSLRHRAPAEPGTHLD